jgi:hypothetical protein
MCLLVITHHRAAIDQLAGAVVNAIGAVLKVLGLIPGCVRIPIEFPPSASFVLLLGMLKDQAH